MERRKPDPASLAALDELRPLLAEAARREASAVHLEPGGARLRVDGQLVPSQTPAPAIQLASDLSTFAIELDGTRWRVSAATVLGGVHVCLRRVASGSRTLRELGLEKVEASLTSPGGGGMTLFCGPPASGKSTTFYAALASLAGPERVIVTLEDPIERRVPGVSQMEGVRASVHELLLQDPDVVGLGEIRDLATAELAVACAMSGARVVSTLAVPRAAAAVSRLLNIGIEPYLVVSTLRQVVCQVLRHRQAVHEILDFTPELRDLILQGASEAELEEAAVKRGMLALDPEQR
jgi:type II secretory ATPase GspE/PulE/Tfp pilus assembly ATPase PilB-like protein